MIPVDVFIACYNYGRYLPDAVGSVLSQQGVKVRLLILDDCSSDNSEEVGRALAVDPRVEFRRHAVNQGHIATYNEGIDWVRAPYYIFLSADDMLAPGALARAAALMNAYPQVGLVHGRTIRTSDPRCVPLDEAEECRWSITPGLEHICGLCATGEDVIETPSVVLRTELQKRLGGYRKELPHSGDMEMWLRFAAHSNLGYVHALQALHRMHDSNMHHGYRGVLEIQQAQAAFDFLFDSHGDCIPDAEALRQDAYRSLAWRAFWKASERYDWGQPEVCRDLLREAERLWPGVKYRWPALKFRAKRLLGNAMWRIVKSGLRRLRGGHCGTDGPPRYA